MISNLKTNRNGIDYAIPPIKVAIKMKFYFYKSLNGLKNNYQISSVNCINKSPKLDVIK